MLPRSTVMFVPDIYPNHVIRSKLLSAGFTHVVMLTPGKPEQAFEGVSVEAVAPMNGFAQEEELYRSDHSMQMVAAVDAGAIVTSDEAKLVLLSDNSPYFLEDAGDSLERMRNADLLAFPFNSLADDFPVCYDDMSLEEKRRTSLARNRKRVDLQAPNIKALAPRAIMPYSSDFVVQGPRSEEFVAVHPRQFVDKAQAAALYSEATGCDAVVLYEGDDLKIAYGQLELRRGGVDRPDIAEVAARLKKSRPAPADRFAPRLDFEGLLHDIERAAANMWSRCDNYDLHTDWSLVLEISDHQRSVTLDFAQRRVMESRGDEEKALTCVINSGHLQSHLDFKSHWNNSMIGHHLSWRRFPQEFDLMLYRALNFFHLPLTPQRSV